MVRRLPYVVLLLTFVSLSGCGKKSDQPAKNGGPPSASQADARYVGHLEAAHNKEIIGWARDKSRPDEAVNVTILDGTTVLTEVKADVFRKDLLDGKIGTGRHGFVVPMPASL